MANNLKVKIFILLKTLKKFGYAYEKL